MRSSHEDLALHGLRSHEAVLETARENMTNRLNVKQIILNDLCIRNEGLELNIRYKKNCSFFGNYWDQVLPVARGK